MRAASHGDEGALSEIVRGHAPDVHRYLAGLLGDPDEADEALQETFVRLARALGRYERGTDVRTFVFGVARKVASDARPTPASSPVQLPEEAESGVAWARRALRSLPIERRELIVARDLLDWDAATIESVLGVPAPELGERLAEARTELLAGPVAHTAAPSADRPGTSGEESS